MSNASGQHFLLSRQAKTLSLATVFRMSDEQAETAFRNIRWADTNGAPVCPQEGLHHHERDAVRLAQAPAAYLPRRHRHLLQRSEGQEHARDEP